jgi:hypothetical protein
MAKLNWQKINQQSKAQSFNEKAPQAVSLNFDDNKLWSLRGKYYGIHYTKLPLHYLEWVLDNSTSGKHKGIAESELYRRFHELSNT